MLKLPGSAAQFLARNWQKKALYLPQALKRVRPSVSRNELGWLATLDDVESRLIFTDRSGSRARYRAEMGPFTDDELAGLPARDWTLLVHDVEKHLPAMRKLFEHIPFIPDWRIDDLMVSFAAPGGGVGPHRDNYDVFLCQGIGVRSWRVTSAPVDDDPTASDDLALTHEFDGEDEFECREGDVLYLPPGVAHWGTATRACMTYSIGMRAPQLSDLGTQLPDIPETNPFYQDPDLNTDEARPGYISAAAGERAARLLGTAGGDQAATAEALGRFVTTTKEWITPERLEPDEADAMLRALDQGAVLHVHGMARIAYDAQNVYANGRCRALDPEDFVWLGRLCHERKIYAKDIPSDDERAMARWLLRSGAFEIPGNL